MAQKVLSVFFFFSRDAHFLWPIVGLDCLGHQSAGFSPIDPFGNAYDLHLSVFRVLGLINACILCLFFGSGSASMTSIVVFTPLHTGCGPQTFAKSSIACLQVKLSSENSPC